MELKCMRNKICYVLIALWVACAVPQSVAQEVKPNVVLILIDDLGWQDVKCYDIDKPSPMETPNIDALAKKGILFWQAYSPAPVCAPSRAAILSGNHPARGEMTSVAGGYPPHAGHPNSAQIAPFYTARMPIDQFSLAEAMKANGYVTAHSGKWHISKHHYDYPTPFYHGFDQSTHDRGVQCIMTPDRLTGFATTDPKDPYRLDENGMPFDVPQDAALNFIKASKDQPFFLYYATWLVHAPIVMRSEALLRKYEQKLGVTLTEEHAKTWKTPGQTNPFYCAMVEQLDYYLGQIFTYLETTEDPRRPGHKLIENTYIIFSSDNGGMEGTHEEIYTDNFPLDRGKISLREGGVRVPLIITGPDIPQDVQTDVMANGLDFYPTILSLIGAEKPVDKYFDGCDLAPLLTQDPMNRDLVRDADGQVRDTMMWHFPQMENSSSIRVGDYKLMRKYQGLAPAITLNRLYETEGGKAVRADIEEAKDLSSEMPEKTAELDALLTQMIVETGGRMPYWNPNANAELPNKKKAPVVLSMGQREGQVGLAYRNNGAELEHADLIYTPNDGREWLRISGEIKENDRVLFDLPSGATHYFVNLVDVNNFMVIHPAIDRVKMRKEGLEFSDVGQSAGYPAATAGNQVDFGELYQQRITPNEGRTVLGAFDFRTMDPRLNTTDKGISILPVSGSTGGSSLELREVEGLEREWMPLVSTEMRFSSGLKSGQFRADLDFILDADAPGALRLSFKNAEKRIHAGDVMIDRDGVKVAGRNVAGIQAGKWYHLEMSGQFGVGSDKHLHVRVTDQGGNTWTSAVPYSHYGFEQPSSLEIIGLGAEGSVVRIDHFIVTVQE
jgi:arylsulfatase A-like enzyme